ncbi:UNVERIFIED_CONTAM: hypothetical protein Scaly_1526800 [Sesamum calycinum]|uniref:DUF3752 domain-containing protein n=1 Tax=Sesamum calycinum TaxID=2727403 RepID=A0AAW2P9K8_9LAMI
MAGRHGDTERSRSNDDEKTKKKKKHSRRDREKRKRRERERERKRRGNDSDDSSEFESDNESSSPQKKKHSRRDREKHKRRESGRERKRRRNDSDDNSEFESDNESSSPLDVIEYVLKEFPAVAGDLEQLLRMIDDGQAVDIRGLSERSLVKHLRRLFISLNLKEKGDLVFLLRDKASPTLDVVGPIIRSHLQPPKELDNLGPQTDSHSVPPDSECGHVADNVDDTKKDSIGPRRRVIGPEMPSAELLAAAAKLTEAEAELRDAELDGDTELFIGPPPPAVVKEAESANEAERFEEITRIIGAEEDSPYDILGVNKNMSPENMKKKRKALDDKIKLKEEQEAFQVELKAMREAAQWRRLQGISMEGDDILLAEMDAKVEQKRDEWMTTLPPERKPGMTMHSTTRFSKSSKEGRGDTSAWTDTPSERAQKAKTNYLEAYNEAAALASNEQEKKRVNADAELVDQYNKAKRSKSLVEKHQDSLTKRPKKKGKQESAKEEWEGNHPWKPWDREKDLTAGRQNVKLDADNMAQGLSSRFSSGSFQRNFL